MSWERACVTRLHQTLKCSENFRHLSLEMPSSTSAFNVVTWKLTLYTGHLESSNNINFRPNPMQDVPGLLWRRGKTNPQLIWPWGTNHSQILKGNSWYFGGGSRGQRGETGGKHQALSAEEWYLQKKNRWNESHLHVHRNQYMYSLAFVQQSST